MIPAKKAKDDHPSFQKPFSSIDNLDSSVKSLSNVNQTLISTIESLSQETREFARQSDLTRYNRHYETVTTSDIKTAQDQFCKELEPELVSLLEEAELLLNTLTLEENELALRLEKQERYLESQKATPTSNKTSSSWQLEKSKEPSLNPTQKLKQLKNRQHRLIQLNELEDRSLEEEQEELRELQRANLQLEKQMGAINPAESALDQGNYENELEQEIHNLEKLALIKRQFLEQHEQQRLEQAKPVEPKPQQEADQLSPSESISLYTNHLGLIKNVLGEINQPNFAASITAVNNCETQSRRYFQALQNEIATQPYKQRDQSKWIHLLARLCQGVMQDRTGKTAGRVLELLLSSADTKIPISTLQEEFPSINENRHNIAKVILLLLNANIIEINETHVLLLN